MPHVKVGTENDNDIKIYYEDHGNGQPVVLIHGYPLNSDSWERQEPELLSAGYRVMRYDRRGFGNSSRPTTGFDYDTFAADLNALLEHLELEDVVLVGFSMGTGEVTRYLGKYGSARVRKAVLFGAIPPFLLKTDDNPEGVDGQVFEGIKAAIVKDRYAYFKDFLAHFYNVDKLAPDRISEQAWRASFNVAAGASPHASYACVDTWLTDFRADLRSEEHTSELQSHSDLVCRLLLEKKKQYKTGHNALPTMRGSHATEVWSTSPGPWLEASCGGYRWRRIQTMASSSDDARSSRVSWR